MRASVPAGASLAGRRLLCSGRRRWLTTAAPTWPSFEYRRQSQDDPRPRKTCTTCGFVNYENPKVVCGSVLTVEGGGGGGGGGAGRGEDLFVLGRRTIHPRRGYWGIPAGFLEIGETGEEGAAREAREEMNADIDVGALLAVYGLPHIGQIQMIYSAVLKTDEEAGGRLDTLGVSAGQETDEVIAVRWEEIPWESLAFPTTSWALWHHRLRAEEAAAQTSFGESTAPGGRRGGEPGVNSVELEGSVLAERVGGGAGGRSRGGGSGGAGLGLGSGLGLVSHGAVFSTPSSNSSVFWSPNKGLHLKDGWNVSTDS